MLDQIFVYPWMNGGSTIVWSESSGLLGISIVETSMLMVLSPRALAPMSVLLPSLFPRVLFLLTLGRGLRVNSLSLVVMRGNLVLLAVVLVVQVGTVIIRGPLILRSVGLDFARP